MDRKPILEKLVRQFVESSEEEREKKFRKLLARNPKFRQISKELTKLERELRDELDKLDKTLPGTKKGYTDFKNNDWRKYI